MVKTKREYVLATCFLTGAAAIISFVSLGTQEWVYADAVNRNATNDSANFNNYVKMGLFTGLFNQEYGSKSRFSLEMVCAFDLNICALLCGKSPLTNLIKLYNNESVPTDVAYCNLDTISSSKSKASNRMIIELRSSTGDTATTTESSESSEHIFINAGIWVCTIIFLIVSGLVGLCTAGLAVWNTATSPYQVYFSIFGLYIYNGIACVFALLSVILWGAMFAQDLSRQIPTYKTFLENFDTKDRASLGYSYWINLISVFFYLGSICCLYARQYLISKEPKVTVQIEDPADPVIYLY